MRPNFYEPASVIREVAGVRRRVIDNERDSFIGSAEGLVATGILTADMLPGRPGGPVSSATYRLNGATWRDPGFLQITVIGVDRYRAVLGVPLEERDRRKQADSAALAKAMAENAKRRPTEEGCQPSAAHQDPRAHLAALGMLHRRKLPSGWRVIEGQRPA